MGKSARAGNKASKTERQGNYLAELTGVIGKLWGDRSECVEASALFAATAERLRTPVTIRAVSVLAIDTEARRVAAIGVAAGEEAESLGVTVVGAPEDVSASSFPRAGHLILTNDALSMVFDPTFRQFSKDGLPEIIVAGKVRSTRPSTGRLNVTLGDGQVTVAYFFDDENTGWQAGVAAVQPQWASVADRLATHIRGGGTAATLDFVIPWDEHPGL